MAGTCRVLTTHGGWVWRVRTDPEGVRVASASSDGTVSVVSLDGAGGAAVTLDGHAKSENSVCWLRGGNKLISGSRDGKVRVFDASNLAAPPTTIDVGGGGVQSVDCGGPDGLILAGCADGGIRVVSAAEGRVVRERKGAQHAMAVRAVNWSPSGTQFASGDEGGKVWVWSAVTWGAERELAGHGGAVYGSVRWSPDSGRIATACYGDQKVRIFAASTGALERTLEGSGMQKPWDADWSPDGHFVAVACYSHKVRVWDVRTGVQVRCFEGHTSYLHGVCWGAGDVLVSGGGDFTVRAWNVSDLCEPVRRRREREERERREAAAARERARLEAEAARRAEVEAAVAPERRAKEAALVELADVSAREERLRVELQREREVSLAAEAKAKLLKDTVAELTQQRDANAARLQVALVQLRQIKARNAIATRSPPSSDRLRAALLDAHIDADAKLAAAARDAAALHTTVRTQATQIATLDFQLRVARGAISPARLAVTSLASVDPVVALPHDIRALRLDADFKLYRSTGDEASPTTFLFSATHPSSPHTAYQLKLAALGSIGATRLVDEAAALRHVKPHRNLQSVLWHIEHTDLDPAIASRLPVDRDENALTGEVSFPDFVASLVPSGVQGLSEWRSGQARVLPFAEVLRIGKDVCAALCHLHRHGLVHMDVRMESVVRGSDGAWMVGDLGSALRFGADTVEEEGAEVRDGEWEALQSARLVKAMASIPQGHGNVHHACPEVLNALRTGKATGDTTVVVDYSRQSVFELGVLLGEVLLSSHPLGKYPHAHATREAAVSVYGEETIKIPAHHASYPDPFLALVRRMLSFDASRRPTLREALEALWRL